MISIRCLFLLLMISLCTFVAPCSATPSGAGQLVIRSGADLDAPIGDFTRLHLIGLSSAEAASAIDKIDRLESLVMTEVTVNKEVWVSLAKHAASLDALEIDNPNNIKLDTEALGLFGQLVNLSNLQMLSGLYFVDGTTEEKARNALSKLCNLRILSEFGDELVSILKVDKLISYKSGFLAEGQLGFLSPAKGLKELVANHHECESFELIGTFTSLQTLVIADNISSTDPTVDSIAALSQLKELRYLKVGELPRKQFSKLASVISTLPKLNTLSLRYMSPSDDDLKTIGRAKSLRTVTLSLRSVSADGIIAMCTDSQITELDLKYCNLPLSVITGLGKVAKIEKLVLPQFVDKAGIDEVLWDNRLLTALCECRHLRKLEVPGYATSQAFQKVSQLKELVSLDISSMDLGSLDDIKVISELENLESLILGEEQCIPGFATVLAKCKAIKRLRIYWRSEDFTGLARILKMLPVDQLTALTIFAPTLNDEVMLDAIAHNVGLVELSLTSLNGCTAASIDHLAKIDSLESLEMDVDKTEKADEVAQALCNFKSLQTAMVYGHQLTKSALKKIAKESTLNNLQTAAKDVDLATLAAVYKLNPTLKIEIFE